MRKTPLYDEHVNLGAEMVDFHDWMMPIHYTSLVDEHQAVREQAGLFDVSHMGEIRVKGPQATDYIRHVFTNDISPLVDGQVIYGFLLNHLGGVVDDLLVYKVDDEEYFLVVNASNADKDFAWLLDNLKGFDVTVTNESEWWGEVALQGPKAQEVLQRLVSFPLDDIKFFFFKADVEVAGVKALISRTGYTGEDGFEIYVALQDTAKVWNAILETGQGIVKPAGLGARDTLRFEAGLPLYGNEMDEYINPIEAGFGFFVDKQGTFIGSDIIHKDRERGPSRKIVGLELLDKGIARHGYPVLSADGEEIGIITTGYKAPTVGKTIALALIKAPFAKLGDELFIEVRNKKLKAVQISKKFLDKKTKKS